VKETNVTRATIKQPGEGRTVAVVGDDLRAAQAGTWVHMPAGPKHSVRAKTPLDMPLVLLK
jgi:hypothetical protein